MAFKVAGLIVLVITVAAEIDHSSFYHDSLTYVTAEGDHDVQDNYSVIRADGGHWIIDSADAFNAVKQRQTLSVIYNPPSSIEGEGSPWNYLIPVENSGSSVPTTYPTPGQVLPLAAPWTHDVPVAYSTSTTPATGGNQPGKTPFGYVRPVAKISVPPGYKIH